MGNISHIQIGQTKHDVKDSRLTDAQVASIAGKEDASNKVTSLSASSTDTQYPSAKCVYDIVGNIETLLAAI